MKARFWTVLGMLAVGLTSSAAAPANDNFNNAIALLGNEVTISSSSVGATKELGEPNHGEESGGSSVWWKWTAPAGGSVIIQTAGSSFDTLLAAYTGASIASLNSVASNDDAGSLKSSLIGFNVTAGTTYDIAVDGFNGASGEIQLSLKFQTQLLERPSNDNFTNRIVLTGISVTTVATNFFASKEPLEPNHADETGGVSVWWTWLAPVAGTAVISTHGSDFDTLMAVYTGAVLTNLTLVAYSDDISTNDPASQVTFSALPNVPYQIAVDGYDGEPGHILLQITMKDLLVLGVPRPASGGGFTLPLTGPAGKQYDIQGSFDLTNWTRLTTLANPTGSVDWTDLAQTNHFRFYRAQQTP